MLNSLFVLMVQPMGLIIFLKEKYPKISLINHSTSKGLIASRNELLSLTKAKYGNIVR